jgi:hypothetical protein
MRTIEIYARQGDLVIRQSDHIRELTLTTAPVVVAGSHGHAHTLPAGVEHAQEGSRHFVRPRTDVQLTHQKDGGHKPVPMVAGTLYEIYPQIERRGEGDQDVED